MNNIKILRRLTKLLIALSGLAALTDAFAAPVTTAPGTITAYLTGWNADQVRVATTAPVITNGCSIGDGYLTNPTDPGNRSHQAALLTALSAGKRVQITVDGCTVDRPRIIGVIFITLVGWVNGYRQKWKKGAGMAASSSDKYGDQPSSVSISSTSTSANIRAFVH